MHHLKKFKQVVHISTRTSHIEYNDPETGQYNMLKEIDDTTKVKGAAWADLKADLITEDLSDSTTIGGETWANIKKNSAGIDKVLVE